jgi:pyruvate ferredoxin oxidoreductase beta subunit
MPNLLQQLVTKPQKLASGHRSCRGCTAVPGVVRQILRATDKPVVVSCATGCMEVTTTPYPETSWRVPWIHSTFENAAATIIGVEAAYRSLKERGRLAKLLGDPKKAEDIKFVAFGGDGGTYDIGLQALSGALERRHNFVYVCYDNEAYMNTGNQKSGATPEGAATTTTPIGKVRQGKVGVRKNLTEIVAAHNIPYVAQTSVGHWEDLYNKAKKALEIKGPSFINVLSPCTFGWKFPTDMGIEIAKLGVETNFWPLYEIEEGKYKLNYKPQKRKPVTSFMKHQGRYKHLFTKDERNKALFEKIQKHIDSEWEKLVRKSEFFK